MGLTFHKGQIILVPCLLFKTNDNKRLLSTMRCLALPLILSFYSPSLLLMSNCQNEGLRVCVLILSTRNL